MKSLTFQVQERKTLEVNGEIYTVLKNDTEIIKEAAAVEKKLRRIQAHQGDPTDKTTEDSIAVIDFLATSVDRMLGEGACEKITGGKTPSIAEGTRLYRLLTEAIMEIYAEDVKTEYE